MTSKWRLRLAAKGRVTVQQYKHIWDVLIVSQWLTAKLCRKSVAIISWTPLAFRPQKKFITDSKDKTLLTTHSYKVLGFLIWFKRIIYMKQPYANRTDNTSTHARIWINLLTIVTDAANEAKSFRFSYRLNDSRSIIISYHQAIISISKTSTTSFKNHSYALFVEDSS